jgi:hypothetical protein
MLNPILEVLWCAKLIGTLVYGDRPFSVGTHGQTRDAEISSLFLYTPGIGDSKTTVKYQIHKENITEGLQKE